MPKTTGDTQEFNLGGAIKVQFRWTDVAHCGDTYTGPNGETVTLEARIVKLEATADCEPALAKGDSRYWFAYWITTPQTQARSRTRQYFGGAGPMLSEDKFLELLNEAKQRKTFFSAGFWAKLSEICQTT